jgi:hypothetical protein
MMVTRRGESAVAANNGPTNSTGCTVAGSCGPTANTHGMSHCTVTVGQNGKCTSYDGGPTGSIWNSTLQVQSGPGGPPGPNTFYLSDSCSMAGCVPRVAQNINNANMWYSFPWLAHLYVLCKGGSGSGGGAATGVILSGRGQDETPGVGSMSPHLYKKRKGGPAPSRLCKTYRFPSPGCRRI